MFRQAVGELAWSGDRHATVKSDELAWCKHWVILGVACDHGRVVRVSGGSDQAIGCGELDTTPGEVVAPITGLLGDGRRAGKKPHGRVSQGGRLALWAVQPPLLPVSEVSARQWAQGSCVAHLGQW